jgi:hypothetical protein
MRSRRVRENSNGNAATGTAYLMIMNSDDKVKRVDKVTDATKMKSVDANSVNSSVVDGRVSKSL